MSGVIAKEWDTYARTVLPQGASDVQVSECRRAFYSGACSLFTSIMRLMGPEAEPTDADMALMDAIETELAAFALSVGTVHERSVPGANF